MLRPARTVAAIHDLSGVGRCALTVVMPVLSVMGAQACPVPTAVLSAHTAFSGIAVHDLTGFLPAYLAHWQGLGLRFDAVYAGYLGSPAQVAPISAFLDGQGGCPQGARPGDGRRWPPLQRHGRRNAGAVARALCPRRRHHPQHDRIRAFDRRSLFPRPAHARAGGGDAQKAAGHGREGRRHHLIAAGRRPCERLHAPRRGQDGRMRL